MNTRALILAGGVALVGVSVAGAEAQELTDFSYKAAHNSFERPFEAPYGYDDLVALYNFNIPQMGLDLAAGHLFHMITIGDLRIPMGWQVGWLNTWSLEMDLCWVDNGRTLVRHFPGMQAQYLVEIMSEYWNEATSVYGTRDRFTVFWFEWKTDGDCDPRDNDSTVAAAIQDVYSEVLSVIPGQVIFTTRDLLEFNGLDPEGPISPAELTWPSPQWLFVNGYRMMFVSQDGAGGRSMFTGEFVANRSSTSPDVPFDDGQLWRLYPDLASAPKDFLVTNINDFLDALGQFNPWGETRPAWEIGLARGFQIVATNDIREEYSVHWGLDYPDGFRWAPPMPMYVGGPAFDPTAVRGTIAWPYNRLRFAEQHLRLSRTINGTGITEPWPVLVEGGTHGIDLFGKTNRFEPEVPMRIQAKPGQVVRLVPGPG